MKPDWFNTASALPSAKYGEGGKWGDKRRKIPKPIISEDVLGWWPESGYWICNYDYETECWHLLPSLDVADKAPSVWMHLKKPPKRDNASPAAGERHEEK